MTNMVEKAFLFALKVHGGQTRKDGKPYINRSHTARTGSNKNTECTFKIQRTV